MAIGVSRRSTLVAACGSLVGAATAGVWWGRGARGSSPTRGRGAPTSFGSVAVLGTHRHLAGHDAHQHGWPHRLVAEVEVHNGSQEPVRVSPGQFRLRIGRGSTVTYYDAEPAGAVLTAGQTLRMTVSFLTPRQVDELSLEYAEAGARRPLRTVVDA